MYRLRWVFSKLSSKWAEDPSPCEGSGRCLVSFDFKRRQILAGKNKKKIIALSSHGSYAAKTKRAGRPSPPIKDLWALRVGS